MTSRRKETFKLICIFVILYFVMTLILIKLFDRKCECYEIHAKQYETTK